MATTYIPEVLGKRILEQAITEDRAAELLECLFAGGSATVDQTTGLLVLAGAVGMAELVDDVATVTVLQNDLLRIRQAWVDLVALYPSAGVGRAFRKLREAIAASG